MRVAVGTGAQLFPGKGGPYDAMKNTTRIGKTALQEVENSVQEAKTNIEEGYERIKRRISTRERERKEIYQAEGV